MAAQGKAFLLQGGDCAESFAEFNEGNLRNFFRVMLQMTMSLMYGASVPVVKVGRIAGQFSKPRSDALEKQGSKSLPSYRGDMVNAMEFDEKARCVPDPGSPAEGLLPVGHDAQLPALACQGRVREPAPDQPLEHGFRRPLVTGQALPDARRPHQRVLKLHGSLRPAAR